MEPVNTDTRNEDTCTIHTLSKLCTNQVGPCSTVPTNQEHMPIGVMQVYYDMLCDMTGVVWYTTSLCIMAHTHVLYMVMSSCVNSSISHIALFTSEAIQCLCHDILKLWYNTFTLYNFPSSHTSFDVPLS